MVNRKTYKFRNGNVIEVEEYHDGNYGAPGRKRSKREKATAEQKKKWNRQEKIKRCRHRLIQYFSPGDMFATWTYREDRRPENMKAALKDFQKAIRKVKREYDKRGKELRWIRNIERGTKGAWHIHLIINEIGCTASILESIWQYGSTNVERLRKSRMYSEDFSQIASYMTKDEGTVEKKKDGTYSKPRIAESNYNTSKNMPLKEPKIEKLKRWKKEVRPKKGYYISKSYEDFHPITGKPYRRYTMIRLGGDEDEDEHLRRSVH